MPSEFLGKMGCTSGNESAMKGEGRHGLHTLGEGKFSGEHHPRFGVVYRERGCGGE